MARWPYGPMAPWPHGPMALWPYALLVLWPSGPIALWPYCPIALITAAHNQQKVETPHGVARIGCQKTAPAIWQFVYVSYGFMEALFSELCHLLI